MQLAAGPTPLETVLSVAGFAVAALLSLVI